MEMTELEKVIKGINCHIKKDCRENACPYACVYACEFVLLNDALELLKEYKRQDGCPCTHCTEWECDEVCEEYKKWKDT